MKDAVIITTTFYPNNEDGKLRKDLARKFFINAGEQDYPVCSVDGGTDDGRFLEEIKKLGVYAHEETQRGLGPSRREAENYGQEFAIKNNLSYICWVEPEKIDFLSSLDFLVSEMERTGTHLIMPSRKKFINYPEAQVHSESFGNQRHTDHGYVDKYGRALDTFLGPKMWVRRVSGFFKVFADPKVAETLTQMRIEDLEKKYKISASEEIRNLELHKAKTDLIRTDHMQHMPVCMMLKKNGTTFGAKSEIRNYDVLSVPVDYIHPKEQGELETAKQATYNAKRLTQVVALDEQFALVNRIHRDKTLDAELDRLLPIY